MCAMSALKILKGGNPPKSGNPPGGFHQDKLSGPYGIDIPFGTSSSVQQNSPLAKELPWIAK